MDARSHISEADEIEDQDDGHEEEGGDEDDPVDEADDDDSAMCTIGKKSPFTILTEKAIKERQEEAIESVAGVLSISKAQASILLQNFEWCVSRVNEEWFADESRVRNRVGLLDKPLLDKPSYVGNCKIREVTCGICLEDHPIQNMRAALCDHFYCQECWARYVHVSITDGPGCLSLQCPNPDCRAAVGEEFILSLVSEEDKTKYRRFLLRSYVEVKRNIQWCPGPGCDYAMELTPGSNVHDVSCDCGHNFCWYCAEEAHRPVKCNMVAKWILKNSSESENLNWILANSKLCPKCKRPIEKNHGCMHMTCSSPCNFQFCWICLGAWAEHRGNSYGCNKYKTERKEGKHNEAEHKRKMAKISLKRYTHYYERWVSNEKSKTKALFDLQQIQAYQVLERLCDRESLLASEVKFITEAWLQIVECRRVLKWTYAYGYYLPHDNLAKKQFFEYLQGEAEGGLERLHHCAENDIKVHLDGDAPTEASFTKFRTKVSGLTSVTRTYFQNLVQALENGLADVDDSVAGNSKVGSSNDKTFASRFVDEGHWDCINCSFANTGTLRVCSVCLVENP